jgi:monofunctional biosynthetic peptidoglycan transglycosylase
MKNWFGRLLLFNLRFIGFSICFSILLVIVLRWLPVGWTPLMFFREMGEDIPEETPVRHQWVSATEIPPALDLAVVCTEDQRFLTHYGFDFDQIQAAMDEADDGGRNRGASTISQQTAKNVFLWPTSSYVRKGFEVWFTLLIETFWSKERILEVYLNSIEFGPGIYGCEAASQYFFDKPAVKMTNRECAKLAVVLPNPLKYNVAKPTQYMNGRVSWAISQMANYGYDIQLTRVNGKEDDDDESSTRK